MFPKASEPKPYRPIYPRLWGPSAHLCSLSFEDVPEVPGADILAGYGLHLREFRGVRFGVLCAGKGGRLFLKSVLVSTPEVS